MTAFSARFDQVAVQYENRLRDLVRDVATEILSGAHARVLRNSNDTGALAESLHLEENGTGYAVVTKLPYARYVEFGTRFQPAQPFLTPAVEEVRVTFGAIL